MNLLSAHSSPGTAMQTTARVGPELLLARTVALAWALRNASTDALVSAAPLKRPFSAGALGKLGRTGGPFALLGWRARNPVNAIHRVPQVAHAQDVTSF